MKDQLNNTCTELIDRLTKEGFDNGQIIDAMNDGEFLKNEGLFQIEAELIVAYLKEKK